MGKKIKVLFIAKWYPNKEDPQLGIFIKKHAQAVALYADVSLIYIEPFNSQTQLTDFYLSEEKKVRQFFLYYKRSYFRMLNPLRYWLTLRRAFRAVEKNSGIPDIIHSHVLLRPALMAWLLSYEHRIPYIITEHWTGFANNKYLAKPLWYRQLCKYVVSKSSALTVVSHALKKEMEKIGFSTAMYIVPNVVDLPENIPDNILQGKKLFLTVADLLDSQKNVSATIRVSARLAQKRNDFEFHIIGSGPDEQMLIDLARREGVLDSFVFFHGRKNNDEVYEHLKRVNFIVVNSHTETFSVVTAEALACGKPVVATISGGPEEIMSDLSGILIRKDSETELENAIVKMLDTCQAYDPVKLQASVAGKYSREKTGEMFYNLYLGILEGKKEK